MVQELGKTVRSCSRGAIRYLLVLQLTSFTNYGPRIYNIIGVGTSESLMNTGISGALSIIYCTIGLLIVDRVGRIKPLIASTIGMASALVTNAALSQHSNENNYNQPRVRVAMNFIFSLF